MYAPELQDLLTLLANRRETADLELSGSGDGLVLRGSVRDGRRPVARIVKVDASRWALSLPRKRAWTRAEVIGTAEAIVERLASEVGRHRDPIGLL